MSYGAPVDGWIVDTGDGEVEVEPPRARPAAPVAPPPGAHDDRLRGEFDGSADDRSGLATQ